MNSGIIAYRYAKALFSLTKEEGNGERVYKDMIFLGEVWKRYKKSRRVFVSSMISKEKKREMALAIVAPCEECTKKLILLLIENRRESLLGMVVYIFEELYRRENNITKIGIETAVPFTEELKKEFLDRVGSTLKGTLEMEEKVNPELIGGYIVRIDGFESDCSISSALTRITKGAKGENQRYLQ
ncbi:MAG TPA: ATP synthase F1 subunit delta [Porphyromonadaceae bacterium]|nr:ATP synthase F1 subunit delta [Porphyromonadaceae bacterium]